MMKQILGAAVVVAFFATAASAGYVPGPLPTGVFGGGTVPQNDDVFKDEQKAAKAGSKLASDVAKCYSKGAKNVSTGKSDGVSACVGTGNPAGKGALDKYAKSLSKLSDLPGCHDYAGDGALIAALVKGFQAGVYCSSPSGAFLDRAGAF
jgi:hypothetical protein